MLNRIKLLLESAKSHQGFKRYLANSSWMFAEQILRLVAGLLVGIWVARYLGPSQFGLFSYAIAFAAIFGSLAKLGLDRIVVRELVRDPNKKEIYLGTAFWLKICGALVMFPVIALATQFTSNDATTNLYIFIIACGAIFQSFEVVDFYFQSKVLSKFVSICKFIQLLVSSLIKLYLVFVQAELFWFVLVSMVDQAVLALSLFIAYKFQRVEGFYRHFDLAIAKRFLLDSGPLILSGMVVMIYLRIDQIMIKEMLGEREVGLYSAAIRISEVWYFLPVVLMNSLFPSIVNAKRINEEWYRSRFKKLYTFLILMSVLIALPMTFVSDWVIFTLYGDAYKEAGNILMIHIWAGVFVSMAVVSGGWYTSENFQRYALYRAVFGACINVLLNLILIQAYGLIGAAIATVIAQFMMALYFDLIFKKTRMVFI